MEVIFQILIAVVLVLFLVKKFMPVKGIETISPAEADEKSKNKKVQCIDVRTPQEFAAGSKRRFQNLPLSEISKRSSELDKDKEVVVLCRSGMRSKKAAGILKKQGFQHVFNVRSGMIGWK